MVGAADNGEWAEFFRLFERIGGDLELLKADVQQLNSYGEEKQDVVVGIVWKGEQILTRPHIWTISTDKTRAADEPGSGADSRPDAAKRRHLEFFQ